ncbi:heparan-alpha-glucosaminide N-acetyltransferase domain-containing protein [Jejuia spongiicola]|uniref:Heparan-alpha-glucosaminide N-acetyltransferase domain-containing protein n=1 Tax=Jejuia spongiicola TaxID=2942207 RepID=A0ABT0QFY3_9FLAO|nr:heparan-alpha-glucosaminide N-acetyltransferase domain-containing protein [Jejuia spongiicola]MCL6295888.1 heparan-alpha-glucosaminide N-acetyltransferase domain-containing protein [Jejuia spongiicola]
MNRGRIASIDILRAITMVLMIWVNDFWTLKNVPKWLQHASATEDYLGFSDVIFPLFLFIVGLSIPFAIKQRQNKGDSNVSIAKHVIIRSVSLLIIGVYMVNYPSAHVSLGIGKYWWCILMALAVVLIWMHWKKSPVPKKWHPILQGIGILILIYLAIIYKGGPNGDILMKTKWWGILGLIGWAYLINALVYVFSKGNLYIMLGLLLFFNALAVLDHTDLLPPLNKNLSFISVIYTGTIPALTTAGIIATLLYKKISVSHNKWAFISLTIIGVMFISYGLLTRPIWGISKIQGTPSWVAICSGIGFVSFAVLYFIADIKKQVDWAKIIAPAGTATLTCYMIPYFAYPLRNITGIRLPDSLNIGVIGLIGSFVFALLVVAFTGWMEKKGYKLKL